MLAVREYSSRAEVIAGYSAVRSRLLSVVPPSVPVPAVPTAPPNLEFFQPSGHAKSILTLSAVQLPKIAAAEIIAAVATAHHLRTYDLRDGRRWKEYIAARHHAVALLIYHRPDLSLAFIGRQLNKDHTTIINARRRWFEIAHEYKRQAAEVYRLTGLTTPMEC